MCRRDGKLGWYDDRWNWKRAQKHLTGILLLAFRNMDTRVYQEPSVSWGLSVSSCVLWERGHNRLRYLSWVSKTTQRENTCKPLSLREGVSPPSAGSSLGDVESRTPWPVAECGLWAGGAVPWEPPGNVLEPPVPIRCLTPSCGICKRWFPLSPEAEGRGESTQWALPSGLPHGRFHHQWVY